MLLLLQALFAQKFGKTENSGKNKELNFFPPLFCLFVLQFHVKAVLVHTTTTVFFFVCLLLRPAKAKARTFFFFFATRPTIKAEKVVDLSNWRTCAPPRVHTKKGCSSKRSYACSPQFISTVVYILANQRWGGRENRKNLVDPWQNFQTQGLSWKTLSQSIKNSFLKVITCPMERSRINHEAWIYTPARNKKGVQ